MSSVVTLVTLSRPWVPYRHVLTAVSSAHLQMTAAASHSNSYQGTSNHITIATIINVKIIHVAPCDVTIVYGILVIYSVSLERL